jgi:hypothetical protein
VFAGPHPVVAWHDVKIYVSARPAAGSAILAPDKAANANPRFQLDMVISLSFYALGEA